MPWKWFVRKVKLPSVLDEELIDIKADQQAKLMRKIKPQFIILKPTLHGGFAHCDQWIHHAQRNNTEWWATSSLESNIGLYHIALWLSKYKLSLPQGFGLLDRCSKKTLIGLSTMRKINSVGKIKHY